MILDIRFKYRGPMQFQHVSKTIIRGSELAIKYHPTIGMTQTQVLLLSEIEEIVVTND